MKHMLDPSQSGMFDPEIGYFSPSVFKRLTAGWQGVFRRSLLCAMPAEEFR